MEGKDNPPIRPGKRFKGGWNPNPGRPDPSYVPAPFGIPFEPAPAQRREDSDCSPDPSTPGKNGARKPVPPIRPGKRFKGGWNPNPGRKDPSYVPAPFGIPFEPAPPASSSDSAGSGACCGNGEREPVPPIRPGKMFKGGWNPDPPEQRPHVVPAPFGVPFGRPPRFP